MIGLIIIAWCVLEIYRALHQGTWNQDQLLDQGIEKGNFAQVQSALAHGAEVNSTSYVSPSSSPRRYGSTIRHIPFLSLAVEGGHRDIVSALLDHGANVNALDRTGETPLIIAVRMNNQGVAQELIQHGADVNAKMSDGTTALSAAKGNAPMEQMLTSAGAKG